MAFFQVYTRNFKITISPFTTDQMISIAQSTLDHIKARIQATEDVTDSRVRPLKAKYAEEKRKGRHVALSGTTLYRGLPVRNWTLRGRTLQSCKVKFASQESATIGPTSEEARRIIVGRNKYDNMWGMSPSDNQALTAATAATIATVTPVKVETEGGLKAA
ncbi:MAG TPA: hypothetical protein VIX19_11575 [Terriglobales bacterium]